MRQRFRVTLAANGKWPDADSGRNLPPFNWIRVDNRGANPVVVAPGPVGATNVADQLDYDYLVSGGKVRVFNVGPPRHNQDPDPVHPDPEMGASTDSWWHEIHLFSALGTTLEVDVADYALVDLISTI